MFVYNSRHDQCINFSNVRKIIDHGPIDKGNSISKYTIVYVDGDDEVQHFYSRTLNEALTSIVPACSSDIMVEGWVDDENGELSVFLEKHKIVAWRIYEHDMPEPITEQGGPKSSDNTLCGILRPDGQIDIPGDRWFKDEKEFSEAVLAEYKKKHAA